MTRELLDATIMTDYGQFDLVWGDGIGFDGDVDRWFAGQENGLVGASGPDGVYLHFARRFGGSSVRIRLHDGKPSEPGDEWEDVVEVSTVVPAGTTVRWTSWSGESTGQLAGVAADSFRVRVSARGRDSRGADVDIAEEEELAELADFYVIDLWPEPVTSDSIVRVGTENARYWHREFGSRR